MYKILCVNVFVLLFSIVICAPQPPEGNGLELTDTVTASPDIHQETVKIIQKDIVISRAKLNGSYAEESNPDDSITIKVYKIITEPLIKIVRTPKVNAVLRNIGTCLVNGAMEIFTFYLPAPFMPLVASAAGLVIPFEPVVLLKEKMPVASYRRAFKTAMNTFMSTFDKYKMEDEFDPYMTRRFNRRFMADDKTKDEEAEH